MDFGCAAYCQYAEQCIGTLPEEYVASQDNLLKDRVAVAMKRYFKTDFRRIGHAMRVARHAAKIGAAEAGDMAVILCAAYLHDIGIHAAEHKYNSAAAKYQELEGPPIAREILTKLGAKKELIEEVCDIIAHHHHPNGQDSLNFNVLFDADTITNLEEKHKEKPLSKEALEQILADGFLTASGRNEAVKRLL
jgi:HD superfamily phosphodiesterase